MSSSLSLVRPYFRARMNALGYSEWTDAFNFQNIPSNIINGAYHIESIDVENEALDHGDLVTTTPVTVRLFLKGFRYPAEAIDKALLKLEDIYKEILSPANRLNGTGGLRNVLFTSSQLVPFDISNDNGVIVVMRFRAQVNVCVIS